MKKVKNPGLINQYIEKYQLKNILGEGLLSELELFKYEKGEKVCNNGDYLTYLFFLVRGKLKIFTTLENGRSILLRFYNPLNIIGDMEVFTDYRVRFNVEALNEVYLIGLPFKIINHDQFDNPDFLRFLIKQLSYKLYTNSITNTINILYPVETRFANYLISIFKDENNSFSVEEIRTDKLTEIADLLGTSYRHLNRVISNLMNEEIITRKKGTLVIKDLDKLKSLASGNLYE